MLTVDEDWGQDSIFINLANRRYLKTVGTGRISLCDTKQTDSLLSDVLFFNAVGTAYRNYDRRNRRRSLR